ncbi:hypothetical protein DFH29DRAFT_970344 [Suillus ampliporus]|nr:hypothetical protein DFH29DRAFT_970344 [Suillus ampliporus]
MVDWDDPDLEEQLANFSVQVLYFILGLYGWEYIRSSHVEISLLWRQIPFRWTLLSYVTGRFSFLIATVLLVMQSSPFPTRVDCQSINTFTIIATNVAVGCSTTNLMFRPWIIWENSYMMRLLLVLLSLGHWALLALFVATARASTQNGVAVVIYNMSYDLLLLVFTIVGLWRMPSSSTLWRTLVKQGVIYFIVNLVALVVLLALNHLNMNAVMSYIFATPGMCPTIASSQVVLLLLRSSPNNESDSAPPVKFPPLMTECTMLWFASVAEV